MELTILNTNLEKIQVLDDMDSMIWTDRYYKYGDFEIVVKASQAYINALQEDYYLTMNDSDHVMIIETVNLKTDVDEGDQYIVTGRSLGSILERRIIWKQTILSGGIELAIKSLLDQNAISPEDSDRKISRLQFEYSMDPAVTSVTIDAQFSGENLYDVIQQLCESNGIGFKISLSADKKFVFKLYAGKDRSFDQSVNPFVAFSPQLDNISNTNYYHSKVPYKTITLVAGEGEGSDRKTAQVSLPGGANTDLDRREKFTDARDVSSLVNGETLSPEAYNNLLVNRGLCSLLESQPVSSFDGTIDPTTNYVYDVDFFVGDIVQIENEYGLRGKSRVTEVVFSEDLSGSNIFPTFEKVE